MQSEEFVRTGDPWIDSGIISLWETIAAKHSDRLRTVEEDLEEIRLRKATATLSSDSLVFRGSGEGIQRLLKEALERLEDTAWQKTKSGRMWWSGMARFFFKQYGDKPRRLLMPLNKLKRKGRRGTCDFCGRQNQMVVDARASEYPFLVASERMSSFYSQLKGTFKVCSSCAFASWFAVRRVLFNVSERTLNAFFFDAPDLSRLARLHSEFGQQWAVEEPYRNFRGMLSYAAHPLENFLSFLLAIHEQTRIKSRFFQGVTAHVFSAKLDGRTVTFGRYYTVPDLPKILDIIDVMKWQSETKQHNALQDVARGLYLIKGGKRDTLIREELARRLLSLSELADVAEDFLFDRGLSKERLSGFEAVSFYQLITKYYGEVLRLEPRILEASRGLGGILGAAAAKTDEKSLLYSLRGLRSLEDYHAYLHQFMVRHEDFVRAGSSIRSTIDTITSEIDERNWRSHRSIVGIYAVLRYTEIMGQSTRKTAEVT
jgi:hypothetical protein